LFLLKLQLSFSAPLEKELVCEITVDEEDKIKRAFEANTDFQGPNDLKKDADVIIINVSPIEFGHCLFVPKLNDCLPQILTEYSIHLALQIMLSSGRKNFKMAFNSLCAYASVNHLHWHLYYLQVKIYLRISLLKS
jgi:hypothetical protein